MPTTVSPHMAHENSCLSLEALGWSSSWAQSAQFVNSPQCRPGRIAIEHKERYRLFTGTQELPAVISGRFRHHAQDPSDFPAVGDWVLYEPSEMEGPIVIQTILPRKNAFTRLAIGDSSSGQVLAANLDTLFVTTSCNADW